MPWTTVGLCILVVGICGREDDDAEGEGKKLGITGEDGVNGGVGKEESNAVGNVRANGVNGFELPVRFGGVKGLEDGDEKGEEDLTITTRPGRFWDATGIWEVNDAADASGMKLSGGFEGLSTSWARAEVEGLVDIECLCSFKGFT